MIGTRSRDRPVLAGVTLVLAVLVSAANNSTLAAARAASPVAAPTGVHVVHPPGAAPYLADDRGRFVLLRGVDDNALVEYPVDYPEAPSIIRADFTEMAALGFNFLRLPVSWSRIMPKPGRLDRSYLDEVARVVSWASAEGIGVLVDMHEDNYSATTYPDHEADGAPSWAVLDQGTPCAVEATTTRCALAAFQRFWANQAVSGRPLQQWYLEAAAAVARAAGATSPTSDVVGLELMNEPWPAGPSPFETSSLYPFYRRMVSGLRRSGVDVPLWFEPSILRNATDDAISAASRFSGDPNLVYALHIYSGVFSSPQGPTKSLSKLTTSYANGAQEAQLFGAPFVVDEYGSSATPAWNGWLGAQLDLQNAHLAGSAFWLWKQRIGHWDNWAVVHLNGSLRSGSLRAQLLSQPHVETVPGRLVSTSARAESLTAVVQSSGGTATLWAGAVVSHGGPTLTTRTLRKVTVDGLPATPSCHQVTFETPSVGVSGCLLTVSVPAGHHVLVASP